MQNIFTDETVVTKIHFANRVWGSATNAHFDRKNHGFAVIFGGSNIYRFENGKELLAGDGAIIYLPKHSNYTTDVLKKGECYCINFSIDQDICNEPFTFVPKNMAVFEKIFKTADRYFTAKREGYETKCRSLLYDFLYHMQTELSSEYADSGKYKIIAPAIDYIHEKYTEENISIAELASMCKISHEYFRRLFRMFYNTTPVAYINSMKIARAKELIESGVYTITEAAAASGYTDMSHFSREFKKATGVAPSFYKK